MTHRALISTDYTFDFVADPGALTCGLPGHEWALEHFALSLGAEMK